MFSGKYANTYSNDSTEVHLIDHWYTLQIILTSIMGGVVRYLSEILIKSQELDKLSLGIMAVHALIGIFSGYISFLVCSLFTTAEVAGVLAAGLGSFGGYGTLFWLIEQMKKKLIIIDQDEYETFMKGKKK